MSAYNRPDDLGTVIRTVGDRLDRLERSRRFTVPVVAADPTDVDDGDMWVNSTSGLLKVRVGGVTKTVTLT